MQIFARTPQGSTVTVELDECSVLDAKSQITLKSGIPAEYQRLTFEGHALEDSAALADYGVVNGSSVDVSLRLVGGVMMEQNLQDLAKKFNCNRMVCRRCYARLSERATNCRKQKCGHCADLREKKKLKK